MPRVRWRRTHRHRASSRARPTSTCRASSPPSRQATRRRGARRSSPRTSSAARARASARSRCSASATASSSTRAARRSRSARCSAMRPTGPTRTASRCATAAPPNGKRVAVVGAGPAGLACAGELAARGYARHGLRRARRGRRARPLRDRAVPADERAAARRGAALAELGVEFRLRHAHRRRAARRSSRPKSTRSSSPSGWARTSTSSYDGDDLQGVWESLPFIEHAEDRKSRPTSATRVAVIGGGNTAVDVAVEAKRLGARRLALLYRRTEHEMPAYEHEVELARREGRRDSAPHEPGRVRRQRPRRGRRCAEMRLGDPDESGRRRPEPVPAASSSSRPTRSSRRSASGRATSSEWIDGLELDGVDRSTRTAAPPNPKFFAGGDAVNGGASVVQAVREAKRAVARDRRIAAMRELTEIRWHARAGQGAKTAAQLLALALLRSGQERAGVPEYGPERRGAPLRAFTRISTGRSAATTPSPSPDLVVVLEPSLVRRSRRRGRSAPRTAACSSTPRAPPSSPARRRCVPATRLAPASAPAS